MKVKKSSALRPLEKGQFWQTQDGDVEIMEVGKILAHYRLFRNQKRAPTSLGRIEMVQDYLRRNGGKLVKNPRLPKVRS